MLKICAKYAQNMGKCTALLRGQNRVRENDMCNVCKTRPGSGVAAMKGKAIACFGIVQAQQSSSDTYFHLITMHTKLWLHRSF